PTQPVQGKSVPRKMLDKVAPRCLDGIVHSCWAQSPGEVPNTRAQWEFARNMEIAKMYFHDKNYVGAESRLREALSYLPKAHEAIFLLACSHQKLGKADDARNEYREYLSLEPSGPHAREAARSLHVLLKRTKAQ